MERELAIAVAEAVREAVARACEDARDEVCHACDGEASGPNEDEPCDDCGGTGREHMLDVAARVDVAAAVDTVLARHPHEMVSEPALRSALQDLCDHRDATLVQARVEMARGVPTIVVTACGAARSIDGSREVEIAKSLGPVLGESMRAFVQGVKDEERNEALALLKRVVRYVDEDRAQTPGSTRLARVCDEATRFIAKVSAS